MPDLDLLTHIVSAAAAGSVVAHFSGRRAAGRSAILGERLYRTMERFDYWLPIHF